MRYRKPTTVDWLRAGFYIFLMLVVTVAGAVLLSQFQLPGMVIWGGIFVASLYLLVRWHAGNTGYRCPACGSFFTISTLTDFVSPHLLDGKWLRCPKCGERRRHEVWMRIDAT